MTDNASTIEYKGRPIFVRKTLGNFRRFGRDYKDEEACFAFLTQGKFRLRDQVCSFDIDRNNAFLAKCTNFFFESRRYPHASEEEGVAIAVFLYPDIFQNLFDFDVSQSSYSTDYNLAQVTVDQLLENYRNSIELLLDSPQLADELLIESKLREFVLLMSKRMAAPSEVDFLSSIFKPHFARFEEVIQKNLYTDLSLEELAALCHMSLSTFKRKFNEVYAESPKKYITRLKIDRAKSLLKNTNKRISEIVFATGFDSVSTFNRAFKAQTGNSPSEYRLS